MTEETKLEPRAEWLPQVVEFFNEFLSAWELSGETNEILMTTCDRLQKFHAARIQIEREGLTFTSSTGVIKTHPLLVVERQAHVGFLAGCRMLQVEQPEDKKPPHRPRKGPGWQR
jgi:hypothetical protein